MNAPREFRTYILKEACFRIASVHYEDAASEIRRQRDMLDRYIASNPTFRDTLEPLKAGHNAPQIARRMASAAEAAGVGPLASVAGVFAQIAGEAAWAAGSSDVIIDNGGDLYLHIDHDAVVGLYSGGSFGSDSLAFLVTPDETPLGICSSSSKMGHSMSLGDCDLATVISEDAALADAAATALANMIRAAEDLEGALERITAVPGIRGALAIYRDRIGTAGRLPRIIRTDPSSTAARLTIHPDHTR